MKPIPTETSTDVGSVGKWVGAAAAGALLMYLLDPERGAVRRRRALSTLRDAGARTGASVDHALHSAGDRLAGLKDSATGALARGASRLQAEAAPVLERMHGSARQAVGSVEDAADRSRERSYGSNYGSSTGGSYDDSHGGGRDRNHDRGLMRGQGSADDAAYRAGQETGRLSQWLRDLGDSVAGARGSNSALLGGGVLGMLGLMRRHPAAMLLGLAGLAMVAGSRGTRSYAVGDFAGAKPRDDSEAAPYLPPDAQPSNRYLH